MGGGAIWWQSVEIRALAGCLVGAIAGSFLAAALIRWPAGRSVLAGRSSCDACGRTLDPIELVPIFSFLMQRGRCRSCRSAIDPRHLAIELAAAVVGGVAFAALPGAGGPISALLGWWLLLIAALDLEHHWLPDRLTLPLLALGFGAAFLGIGPPLVDRAIGAAAGFAVLALLSILYERIRRRRGLGGGDPKLLAALGAWLGWQALPLMLLGAGLLGLLSLLVRRARGEAVAATDRLPLGTLMALAAWPLWLLAAAGSALLSGTASGF